jgi:hypothetical protein
MRKTKETVGVYGNHVEIRIRTSRVCAADILIRSVACAVAQAVGRGLPPAAAMVRDRGKSSVGSMVARAAMKQVFSEYVGFPVIHSFHQLLHIHYLSSRAGIIGR